MTKGGYNCNTLSHIWIISSAWEKTTLVQIKDEDGVEHKMTIGELIEFLKE